MHVCVHIVMYTPVCVSVWDVSKCQLVFSRIIIQLEARLQLNIEFTLRGNLAVFTLSAITPPKVNQFG